MSTTEQPARLYGGWRRSRSLGIGLLNGGQTVVIVAAILVPIFFANLLGLRTLLVSVPLALVVIVLACWQRHGMPLLDLAVGRMRWQWAAWRAETSYRGLYQPHPKALDLPGVLAPTRLLAVEDSNAGRAGLVWNQSTGQMASTLLLSPGGALLANRAQVNQNVTSWGNTLASLANEDSVDAATVTLQITPASGAALGDHVRGRIDNQAPDLARATVNELVKTSPRASAQLFAWLTLVTSPGRATDRPGSPEEAAAETLRRLDGVDLTGVGADVLRRATATDIVRLVRGAFHPEDADAAEADMEALTWDQAGPIAAEEGWTDYRHDGAMSVSWVLREAPRKPVTYDVLLPLMTPGRFVRRITLGYRILPTEEAAAVVERELNASDAREEYRRRSQRTTTRRERADAAAADRNAEQEAYGAGLAQWTIHITTTVTNPADLPAAQREVEQIAKRAGGLRFRYAYGGQSAAFVAGLPVGVHPLA
ncbi:SCO6880 family protein [Streptomyces sp. NRRL F-525]|uniref:SCO6880 family protein n=1 Tax=Streptomyces sp. NRRL F-525 TaxID=1463861 RepID=UPI0006902F73|nr:SCO6880 family protein [Streptomyces sp. NRRL F-525]